MTDEGVDAGRLVVAYETVRRELLAERTADGHWVGQLAGSPPSTAVAVSALVLAHHDDGAGAQPAWHKREEYFASDQIVQGDLSELIVGSLFWLARHQNQDGGWGDTDRSLSNLPSTMLVRAAFQLTGVPARFAGLVERADRYISSQGGVPALRRHFGKDKTWTAAVLMNSALAGLIPWRHVPALPFEWACVPQRWYHRLRLPVVSFAIPALVSIGQAKFHHDPPRNPLLRRLRRWASQRSLAVVERMQAASGGFLEATPLTSFVVMSMASTGRANHSIVRQGVEFLLSSVRADGSWSIDTNLSTWNTTLAVNALLGMPDGTAELLNADCLGWLLKCQHTRVHPYTGAAAGGWAWTDEPGGVSNANDTAGVLLSLAGFQRAAPQLHPLGVDQAARSGIGWLLDLQNHDGGWPTFCRGWGALPLDRSASDVTAHALRALSAWRECWSSHHGSDADSALVRRIDKAVMDAIRFLEMQQRDDGSFIPLWFGSEYYPQEENPLCGTAIVLTAMAQLNLLHTPLAQRAAHWLKSVQLAGGGWGPPTAAPPKGRPGAVDKSRQDNGFASVEETALAVTALEPFAGEAEDYMVCVRRGMEWLLEAVEQGRHRNAAPIGFYFARILYYEQLYPLVFATGALAQSVRRFARHGHALASIG